jgi:hypothetical protein
LDKAGIALTVLASNTSTGSYEITLQEGPEGAGHPPHASLERELLRDPGSVLFRAADAECPADRRTLAHVPADTVHAFRFGLGPWAMRCVRSVGVAKVICDRLLAARDLLAR